jgi:competence protein ComGC
MKKIAGLILCVIVTLFLISNLTAQEKEISKPVKEAMKSVVRVVTAQTGLWKLKAQVLA